MEALNLGGIFIPIAVLTAVVTLTIALSKGLYTVYGKGRPAALIALIKSASELDGALSPAGDEVVRLLKIGELRRLALLAPSDERRAVRSTFLWIVGVGLAIVVVYFASGPVESFFFKDGFPPAVLWSVVGALTLGYLWVVGLIIAWVARSSTLRNKIESDLPWTTTINPTPVLCSSCGGSAAPAPGGSVAPAPGGSVAPAPGGSAAPAPGGTSSNTP